MEMGPLTRVPLSFFKPMKVLISVIFGLLTSLIFLEIDNKFIKLFLIFLPKSIIFIQICLWTFIIFIQLFMAFWIGIMFGGLYLILFEKNKT